MISLNRFLDEFGTASQLYRLLKAGMKLIANSHEEIKLDSVTNVSKAERLMLLSKEMNKKGFSYKQSLEELKENLFVKFIKQHDKEKL